MHKRHVSGDGGIAGNTNPSSSTSTPVGFSNNSTSSSSSTNNSSSSNSSSNSNKEKQEVLCRRILSTSDYYELLGVNRNEGEDVLKRAYKRLALQLHPDKNSAPNAEEAFKKVSTAFQCLSDNQRRAYYDQFGNEDDQPSQSDANADRHHGSEFMTPEELFQAFFGVDISGSRTRVFRRQPQRPRHQPTENQQRFYGLVQFLPVMLLLLVTFFSNLSPSPPKSDFAFSESPNFPLERYTGYMRVRYYVPHDFNRYYPPYTDKLNRFEREVELTYYTKHCHYEEEEAIKKIRIMSHFGSSKEKAELKIERPHCEKLLELRRRS